MLLPAVKKKVAFVGLDVHKRSVQVSMMDKDGNELVNGSIGNTKDKIQRALEGLPNDVKIVMESSSVWKDIFSQLRDSMGYDVILSNPFTTKLIAESKKKTDKVDARILADMIRGGYIAECHIPSKQRMESRDLVRYRHHLVSQRTDLKNSIQGILLQKRVNIPGTSFSNHWNDRVRTLKDYRIDENLKIIYSINDTLARIDAKVRAAAKNDPDAVLLMSIPGVGPYIGLTMAAEIDGVERFSKAHKLCAYAGLVPSVRSSGETIHYGRITRHGSAILRWIMTEAILSHIRYAPESDVSVFYRRIAKKRGRSKAVVAGASLLLRVGHRMLRERKEFVQNFGSGK